ncbi:hypothetical protein [Neptuniibacter sp. 1_MG-2023]|uniref:hypothetical protein n=1 Tax=Neptuniibacter sp. 1_MG-2023 TaxID=3062662 RepID=UPI0026E48F32|nr:hypothetical protein [Neptuniibacter sp. 1_MG-2023]MDO6595161.1 hypothetical protein [Neptuniibacter sp. 1_MG-2023]
MKTIFITTLLMIFSTSYAVANSSEVTHVDVRKTGGNYNFSVTIKHADTGWDHYANKWEVVGDKGEVYGTRILHHPHVNEQPFTRSLSNVKIPAGIKSVIIRSYDSVHGLGEKEFRVELP